jgi:hypothetical protein
LWRDRKGPKGALLFADGRLNLRSEESPIVLIEPSKEGYKELARFEQPDRLVMVLGTVVNRLGALYLDLSIKGYVNTHQDSCKMVAA